MSMFEKILIDVIVNQFNGQKELKRIILQDIPVFVQNKLFDELVSRNDLHQSFLFTNAERNSINNIRVMASKEEILSFRNDYSISQVVIISKIALDRSNESSVTTLNDLPNNKWLWIESQFGLFFIKHLEQHLGKDNTETIKKILIAVGQKYEDGIEKQWILLIRIFDLLDSYDHNIKDNDNTLAYMLGIPSIGTDRKIEDSIAIIDSALALSNSRPYKSIPEMIQLGLHAFKKQVIDSINFISENSSNSDYKLLEIDLINNRDIVDSAAPLASIYIQYFESYYEDLVSKSINPLEISMSPLFFYIDIRNNIMPKWWRILTSNFWIIIFKDKSTDSHSIKVTVQNKEKILSNKTKGKLIITASDTKGRVDFKVDNFEELNGIVMKINENNVPIQSDTISYTIENYISKPETFNFIAQDSQQLTYKIMPVDKFECGVIPFIQNDNSIILPQKKGNNNHWKVDLNVTFGQNKLILLIGDSFSIIKPELKDLISNTSISLYQNSDINIWGVKPLECILWIDGDVNEKSYQFIYNGPSGRAPMYLDITLNIFDSTQDEVNSVFRRLVKEHIDHRKSRVSPSTNFNYIDNIESWIIDNPSVSHKPLYLSMHQVDELKLNLQDQGEGWYSLDNRINSSEFIVGDYSPPPKLILARQKVIQFIKDKFIQDTGSTKLLRNIELAQLGDVFDKLVIDYLDIYYSALIESYDSTIWFDIHPIVNDLENDVKDITSSFVEGLLVSPYHPLRLYWQVQAQRELISCLNREDIYRYNPAASVLDPSIVPDFLFIKLRSTVGYLEGRFISLVNDSDYWGVLLRGDTQTSFIPRMNPLVNFCSKLGMKIEGLNQGLFASQIERSLKDVSKLMITKDKLRITVQGNTKGHEVDGIFNWLKKVTGAVEETNNSYLYEYIWSGVRKKSLEVYDIRDEYLQPDDHWILDQYLQVGQNIKWYNASKTTKRPEITDLSILSNVELSTIIISDSDLSPSPSIGALLYKHRLVMVKNESNRIPLIEQRRTISLESMKVPSDLTFLNALKILEGINFDTKTCVIFTPRMEYLNESFKKSHLTVVSSSLVSPTTFSLLSKNDNLNNLYLWDFDLPSFNNTSNTKNGYYLLAHPKNGREYSTIKSGFSKQLELFNHFNQLTESQKDVITNKILTEYIERGLPALKKLVYGGNAFRGEIGNIIALRVIQNIDGNGIIPVVLNERGLNLIIPIDPFQDILEKIPKGEDDDRSRPDFIVISYFTDEDRSAIKFTPIEVKFRTNDEPNWMNHLQQASKFSKFLEKIYKLGDMSSLWQVTFSSIIDRIVEYGLNVATAAHKDKSEVDHIYRLGFKLMNDITIRHESLNVVFDESGKLIYINTDLNGARNSLFTEIHTDSCLYIGTNQASEILFEDDGVVKFLKNNIVDYWNFLPDFSSLSGYSTDEKLGSTDNNMVQDSESANLQTSSSDDEEVNIISTFKIEKVLNNDQYLNLYPEGLKIAVGKLKNNIGEKTYYYNPGSTNVNQLNIGIIGDLGTGKTQLLKNLVYSMSVANDANRGKAPKFLILDTKRDYDGSDGGELSKKFLEKINAKVINPYRLKINLFDIRNSIEQNPALTRAKFFSDVLGKIYKGIGPVQKSQILRAVMTAFEKRGYIPDSKYDSFVSPTIRDVFEEYVIITGGQIDAPYAIIQDLLYEGLFEENSEATVSFGELFSETIVLALGKIANSHDSLKLMMVVFLKLYQEYMLSIEKSPYLGSNPALRKVDSFILIDEAKLIMDYGFPVLEDLLRKGREFGIGVILSTQYMNDFTGGSINYKEPLSTWFVHKVPNISAKDLKSIGIHDATDNMASQIQSLQNHFCLYKTVDVNGRIMRGIPLYENLI